MRKGFTLIEILIVSMVIAVLVAVAVPAFRGVQIDAKQSRAMADLKVLRIAINSYVKNNNDFPDTSFGVGLVPNWEEPLLDAFPRVLEQKVYDPFRPGQIEFQYSADGSYFVVWSVGMDGTATITGINSDGEIEGLAGDDLYQTNTQRL